MTSEYYLGLLVHTMHPVETRFLGARAIFIFMDILLVKQSFFKRMKFLMSALNLSILNLLQVLYIYTNLILEDQSHSKAFFFL